VNPVLSPGPAFSPRRQADASAKERPPRPPDERPWRPRTGERGGDQDTLPAVRIGSHHRRSQPALPRRLLQLRHALDPGRPRATGNQERPHDPARIASARRPRTSPPASTPLGLPCRLRPQSAAAVLSVPNCRSRSVVSPAPAPWQARRWLGELQLSAPQVLLDLDVGPAQLSVDLLLDD
jgi:hypothetical protein